ncbi:MAG TPA: hypothetical protein VN643_07005 [Pyrinomonadaceae bacterium]|nr:hypothetical protein [Pyrinomonadaceae bacterium]
MSNKSHFAAPIFIICLALASASSTAAQRPRDSNRDRDNNERELELHIWNLRMLSEQARKPEKRRRDPQQSLAQIQEDYTKLQIVNRDLGRAAIKADALDLRFVTKSAADLGKYAQRLNENLALPQPDPVAEDTGTDLIASRELMKPAILKLVRLTFRFVDNPFFKEASVIDTQQTTAARRDLEEVIRLSDALKKSSEKLNEAERKKQ